MKIPKLLWLALLLSSLAGCYPTTEVPINVPAGSRTAPEPYLGTWKLTEMFGRKPTGKAYMRIRRRGDQLKVLGAEKPIPEEADPGVNRKEEQDLILTRAKTKQIACLNHGGKKGWDVLELELKQGTLRVAGLDPDQVKRHIRAGVLRGRIEVLGRGTKEAEEQARITATGAELRSYIETRAVFVKLFEFEKVP